jgi:aldehyde dehydrogenase (NAD+)
MKEEVFGPVLPVMTFGSEGDLLERLGKLESPLAVYCFSTEEGFVEKVTGLLPSGSLCVNDTMKQFSQLQLPLGGVGQSGSGRYRGRFGVEALSYEKSVTKRYFVGKDLMEMMPPYEKAFRWIKKFMR